MSVLKYADICDVLQWLVLFQAYGVHKLNERRVMNEVEGRMMYIGNFYEFHPKLVVKVFSLSVSSS